MVFIQMHWVILVGFHGQCLSPVFANSIRMPLLPLLLIDFSGCFLNGINFECFLFILIFLYLYFIKGLAKFIFEFNGIACNFKANAKYRRITTLWFSRLGSKSSFFFLIIFNNYIKKKCFKNK